MTVLRSREVLPRTARRFPLETVQKGVEIEPLTPEKAVESTNQLSSNETPTPVHLGLRRSVRLSSKLGSVEVAERLSSRSKRKVENCEELIDLGGKKRNGSESSKSKARVLRVLEDAKEKDGERNIVVSDLDIEVDDRGEEVGAEKVNRKRRRSVDVELWGSEIAGDNDGRGGCLNLRSGKKILKSVVKPGEDDDENPVCRECGPVLDSVTKGGFIDDAEKALRGVGSGSKKARRRISRGDKKKGVLVDDVDHGVLASERKSETEISEEMEIDWKSEVTGIDQSSRLRFSREEKGKGKVGQVGSSNCSSTVESCSEPKVENLAGSTVSITRNLDPSLETNERADASSAREYKERFKKIARSNASRFAHFSAQEEEEDPLVDDAEIENPEEETNMDVEDWPGPFSTALKIIKDRAIARQPNSSLEKTHTATVEWIPKKDQQHDRQKKVAPSLQELCMPILAENVEAIISLDSVPDSLRHKLAQLLCDCRKMNGHFLELLTSGSPSEIRIRDSSWLTEEDFTKTFERTDFDKLMVLQLDQCGRCLPDYVLFTSLARTPNKLSALTTISLKGACRLSDSGLSALVSSAPALRSVNLGCCSMLTSDGINDLADKLRSVLKELYIDECSEIDAMRILPALLKVEHLEVLSMSDSKTVCDAFIKRLVAVRGQNMKELVLSDCSKLTDSSLKAIAENCPGLCAIDLSKVKKLTDSAIGYLANGCRGIQKMILRWNAFSDEAVAAYLEACGEPLKELSLNHVDKVAHDTALSLSKHSRNLLRLDLSWCRHMTDEAVGLIVDSCSSLKMLKLFGCTQITSVFTDGHSNQHVKILGLGSSKILKDIEVPDLLPLRYSSASIENLQD